MTFGGQQFFQHTDCGARLNRIIDGFFGNSDAPFAESLEDVLFRDALQSFKLNVADDREFPDVEGHSDAATRSIFNRDSRLGFFKKTKRVDGLQVTRDLICVVRVTGTGLKVVDNVVFAQTTIALNIDFFNQTLRRLLGPRRTSDKKRGSANGDAQNSEPDDAIRVHK